MDSHTSARPSTKDVAETAPALDQQRHADTSPLRRILRDYFKTYPSITAARVGPQGDDL
jgi:hypothetical protein